MKLLSNIYMISIGATFLVYLFTLSKVHYSRVITLYLTFVIAGSLLAMFVFEIFGTHNNLFIFHFYAPIEYTLLAWLYYPYFDSAIIRRVIVISVPVFISLCLLLTLFVNGLEENNSYAVFVEALLVSAWSLLLLRETLILQKVERLQRFPLFWISIGFLFYFIGHLFSEGLMNYLMKQSMDLALKVYTFSFIFKFTLFILLIVGAYSEKIFKVKPS